MFPSRRIIRFFLIYGTALFFMDQYVIDPARSMMESFAIVLAAVIVAIGLYALLGRLLGAKNSEQGDS